MSDNDIPRNETGLPHGEGLTQHHRQRSAGDPEAEEFMAGVTGEFDLSRLSPMSRKQFLALAAASAAFATAGCTRYRDKGEIVPYTKQPEGIIPGIPVYYASTCTSCSQACGILIKTREGRPIKIDGNPDHPGNRGKICAKGQAGILNLYDPYRLRTPARGSRSGKTGELSWAEIDRQVPRHLGECSAASREIAIVTHAVHSPTASSAIQAFLKAYPTSRVYSYDLFHDENRLRAWQRAYGESAVPAIQLQEAKVVLALECDFLGTDGETIENIRRFTQARDILNSKQTNRLYAIEGDMSLTGANADYRLRLRPDAQLEFVLSLLNEIALERRVGPINQTVDRLVSPFSLARFAEKEKLPMATLDRLVGDLLKHRGHGMVIPGSVLSEDVHIVVLYLNEVLGNTRLYADDTLLPPLTTRSSAGDLESLVGRMKSGEVGAVIHLGSNPAFHLPRTLDYAEGIRKVPLSMSLVEAEDETASLCTYVLPVHNGLESWGDSHRRSGVYALQQPVISPLYESRQKEAILLGWIRPEERFKESLYHEFLMGQWRETVYRQLNPLVDFQTFWYAALHDGVVTYRTSETRRVSFRPGALGRVVPPSGRPAITVVLTESPFLGDGRFANNGWLQEMPHPVSKIVWDNYAALSPGTAAELDVETNDRVEVRLPHGTVAIPVFVQPGVADQTLLIPLGYGRWNAGPVGSGVGTDALPLLAGDGLTGSRVYPNASVRKAPGRYSLVSTQEHHSLDDPSVADFHRKRKIIQEGTLRQYLKDPKFLHHDRPTLFSISKEVTYTGVKWAMAIDLNKCVGCNVCVSACNVENNVQVVGKEQVEIGREMQWIRVDRYYSGTDAEPIISHQPMLCQHCDNAPCENVCPVVATTHSPDGLNQMVYNRCVGTKYCSNNCPYKVRRFNFYNFRDHFADGYYEQEPINLLYNPDVTVRSRGVMEKCTFCIQRIAAARQQATRQGREVRGTDVTTACQEACPARAIVFGDMNDPESEISRYRKHTLGYSVIEEINTRPNVTYMARLRNVDSEHVL